MKFIPANNHYLYPICIVFLALIFFFPFLGSTYQIRIFSTPDAGHGQPFYYHFVVVLVGCFPISLIALLSFRDKSGSLVAINFRVWMLILFWVVLILFSLVTTKIVHYSSMAWLPVSFLAAYYLYLAYQKHLVFPKLLARCILIGAAVWSILLCILPFIDCIIPAFLDYIKDPFAVAILSSGTGFSGYESIIGAAYMVAVYLAIQYFYQAKTAAGISVLLLSTATCVFFVTNLFVGYIDSLSQASAINCCKLAAAQTSGFADHLGYKSYSHLFYAQKTGIPAAFIPYACPRLDIYASDFVPIIHTNNAYFYLSKNPENYNHVWQNWLLNDKHAPKTLFISKIDWSQEIINQFHFLIDINHQKGFIFLEKQANS